MIEEADRIPLIGIGKPERLVDTLSATGPVARPTNTGWSTSSATTNSSIVQARYHY